MGTLLFLYWLFQGYESIPSALGKSHLRRIRGDNYCAIRATIYQCLVNNNIDLTQRLNNVVHTEVIYSLYT